MRPLSGTVRGCPDIGAHRPAGSVSRVVATACAMFGMPARIDDAATLQFDETAKVCAALSWVLPLLAGHYPLATRNLDCVSVSGPWV